MNEYQIVFTVSAISIIAWVLGHFAEEVPPISVLFILCAIVLFVGSMLKLVYAGY